MMCGSLVWAQLRVDARPRAQQVQFKAKMLMIQIGSYDLPYTCVRLPPLLWVYNKL